MSRCPGKLFRIVVLGFLVWFSPDAAWAQSSQAMLLGRVSQEATGEPVAKALVIQRNLQTNVQSYRYTNEQGLYSFPTLQPGTYSVRVDALGFRPEERSPVELPVGARRHPRRQPRRQRPLPEPPQARSWRSCTGPMPPCRRR